MSKRASAAVVHDTPHPVLEYERIKDAIESGGDGEGWEVDIGNDDGLKRISSALAKVEKVFAVGAAAYNLDIDRKLCPLNETHLKLADGTDLGTLRKLDLVAIEKVATVAPFGRGTESVVDPTVRCALEIPAALLDPATPTLIAQKLYEGFNVLGSDYLVAKLYKMHIYKEGGFFAPHADTLHAPNHVATLVVGLPVAHEGGALVVRCNEHSESFTFSTDLQSGLRWAAFYTDCIHEVMPVTRGTRVVLQYDLFAEKPKGAEELTEAEDADAKYSAPMLYTQGWMDERGLERRNRDDTVADVAVGVDTSAFGQFKDAIQAYWSGAGDEDTRIGILMRHRYSMASLDAQYLKGFDRQLYDVCAAARWMVHLKSVIIKASMYNGDGNHEFCQISAHPFDLHDIKHSSPGKRARFIAALNAQSTVILVPSDNADLTCLYHRRYIERTGNEPAPEENTYFSAAMLLQQKPKPPPVAVTADAAVLHMRHHELIALGFHPDNIIRMEEEIPTLLSVYCHPTKEAEVRAFFDTHPAALKGRTLIVCVLKDE